MYSDIVSDSLKLTQLRHPHALSDLVRDGVKKSGVVATGVTPKPQQ